MDFSRKPPKALGKSNPWVAGTPRTIFGPPSNFPNTLKLQNTEKGLIVHEIAGRIEGKTILRPIKLKEAKPLLRRASP